MGSRQEAEKVGVESNLSYSADLVGLAGLALSFSYAFIDDPKLAVAAVILGLTAIALWKADEIKGGKTAPWPQNYEQLVGMVQRFSNENRKGYFRKR